MLEILVAFSIMKSIMPIIILWRPKISIVPMEIRVMMRVLMLFRDLAKYMKAYTDIRLTT